MSKKEKTAELTTEPIALGAAEKKSAVNAAIANIEKAFGKGSILKRDSPKLIIDCISTGCLSLDEIMGGGFPRGRISEVFGPEGCGKTTLALTVVAQAQKAGGIAAFIDMEHALDVNYALALEVDMDNIVLAQPSSGEQALAIAEQLVLSGGVDIVVVDSVAALIPKSELEGDIGDSSMGTQARLMSQFFRKVNPKTTETKTHLLFINQLRMKLGVMYGNPETTTGGNALKFYATHRLDLRKTEKLESPQGQIGNKVKVKCIKNKIAPPFRDTELNLYFGQGFDRFSDILKVGVERGVIEKNSSWYSFNGEKIGQGEKQVCALFREDPKLLADIQTKILGGVEDVSAWDADGSGHSSDGSGELPS
jgi:recombination protein RecA